MKVYAGCFLILTILAVFLALGAAEAQDTHKVFLPSVAATPRECRLILFEDSSWMSPDYHPSEGWPPDPACHWVFEGGSCD